MGEEQQLPKPHALQGGRCEGRFALPASQAPHHSSLLFLSGPHLPLPSHADLVSWITQESAEYKSTTATTMVCQSPVLTLFSPALKVTAEERD